ncbi:MAG: DUF3857 domain-containing protein [Acidobacteria bacterium]|nr:DUF3857 domain-containing protein [Acidobacteriota bacterium]
MLSSRRAQVLVALLIAAFQFPFLSSAAIPKLRRISLSQSSPVVQNAPKEQKTEKNQDYAEEAYVIESSRTNVRFNDDGTGSRTTEVRIRVQSDAGVEQLGQLVFGYNAANENLSIDYVRVRKGKELNDAVITAKPDAVQEMTAPIARDAPVYTDYKQKHVTVPSLQSGNILEYKTTITIHTPLAPGNFWLDYNFEKTAIVLEEELVVVCHTARRIKEKTAPEIKGISVETGANSIRTWKNSHLVREKEDEKETPSKRKERRKREKEGFTPDVQLTTFQSWEEVGRWYSGLEKERVAPSDEVRKRAAEIIRDRPGDLDKIEALYKFVAGNFRYVSLSFGVGRYQPHAASEVLANQYGDCKDKHTLLAALLDAAGFKAYPVLIHHGRKIDPGLPSPAQFDHVITAVSLANDLLWMDTTTEIAPFRLLSPDLRKKQALLVPRDGVPKLVETPADPPFPSTQRLEIDGTISDLGKLSAKVHQTMRGDGELILRMAFRRTPQTRWKQLTQAVAGFGGLRGEVKEVNVTDAADTTKPFELDYQIEVPNFLDWTGKKSQLAIPLPNAGLPQADAEEEEDGESIELGSPLEIVSKLKLKLPDKFTARAPVPINVKRDYAEYHSAYKMDGGVFIAERTLHSTERELPAARTRDFIAFARAVRADQGQTLQVENTIAGTPEIPKTAKSEELFEAAGVALRNQNFQSAVDLLKRVTDLEPKHKRAWFALAVAYAAQRNFPPAIDAVKKHADLSPYDEDAFSFLGQIYLQEAKFPEAVEALKKQLEIAPLNKSAQGLLGMAYRGWKKYAEAATELEKAVSLNSEDANLRVALGECYLNLDRGDEAVAAFDKAVELAPNPVIWNNIAYQLALKKVHMDRAQQYAESAVAATAAHLRNVSLARISLDDFGYVSSLAAYWDTLGWIYFQKGDLEKAEKYVQASWLTNFHGEVGYHLGMIFEKQNRKGEASRIYTIAAHQQGAVNEIGDRMLELLLAPNPEVYEDLPPGISDRDVLTWNSRSKKIGNLLDEKAEADFFVLFAPGPNGGLSVEDVKFIRGNEKLRMKGNALRDAALNVVFPDNSSVRVLRRGTMTCNVGIGCRFTLFTADNVTSLN